MYIIFHKNETHIKPFLKILIDKLKFSAVLQKQLLIKNKIFNSY